MIYGFIALIFVAVTYLVRQQVEKRTQQRIHAEARALAEEMLAERLEDVTVEELDVPDNTHIFTEAEWQRAAYEEYKAGIASAMAVVYEANKVHGKLLIQHGSRKSILGAWYGESFIPLYGVSRNGITPLFDTRKPKRKQDQPHEAHH